MHKEAIQIGKIRSSRRLGIKCGGVDLKSTMIYNGIKGEVFLFVFFQSGHIL